MSRLAAGTPRVGLTFHRTFPLNAAAISKIITLSSETQGRTNAKEIRDSTGLGTIYVEAMPRYARGCGLMEMGSYRLTPLGELVFSKDPHLMLLTTLWVMHYHMSAPQGPGPAFWSHLITQFLPFGDETTSTKIAVGIASFLDSQPCDQKLQDRTVRSTATIFVHTYDQHGSLGQLGLLKEIRGRDSSLQVSDPLSPPVGVVAYALADYWSAHYGDQVTVSLSELTKDDGFARVMWMDRRHLDEALESLRLEGILDLYRVAPPFQVARRWSSKESLLPRLYG